MVSPSCRRTRCPARAPCDPAASQAALRLCEFTPVTVHPLSPALRARLTPLCHTRGLGVHVFKSGTDLPWDKGHGVKYPASSNIHTLLASCLFGKEQHVNHCVGSPELSSQSHSSGNRNAVITSMFTISMHVLCMYKPSKNINNTQT